MMENDLKIGAIIPIRVGSTRFPNKCFYKLNGKPAYYWIYKVLKRSFFDIIPIAAIADSIENDILDFECRKVGYKIYRGDENDVLGRYYNAAKKFNLDIVIDITADCPLIDINHIDILLFYLIGYKYDYCSNIEPRCWPDGFDIQVYTMEILEKINTIITDKTHRLHSGWNILNSKAELNLKTKAFLPPKKYWLPDMGLTLDTKEDGILLDKILQKFGKYNFTATEIIDYVLDNNLYEINEHIERKIPGDG